MLDDRSDGLHQVLGSGGRDARYLEDVAGQHQPPDVRADERRPQLTAVTGQAIAEPREDERAEDVPLQPPADAATVFAGLAAIPAGRTGEELVRRLIGLWEERPEVREQMAAILRAGLSNDRAGRLLRDILSSFILAALGDVLADDRRELRVALIGSHIGGLMLARYILRVPGAAAASPEDLVQAVGPTVQRYLTGDIGPADVSW